MVKVILELPRGAKAEAKRDGYTFVKYSSSGIYRLRRKSKPELVENNQHFGEISTMLSQAYKSLTEREREGLKKRMKKEKSTRNAWVQFRREYFRDRENLFTTKALRRGRFLATNNTNEHKYEKERNCQRKH
ncbi:hypothetical protein JEZ13_00525 [bacterium]|nr:hypothetical protein [bacterium]